MTEQFQTESIPRVSIGLPVYNGDDHLAEAIESVLSQTYQNFELVICDNASTDRTEEICRKYAAQDSRVRYHRNSENIGATGNFRRTFELASAEFFNWLSHDDLLGSKYLESCLAAFDRSPANVVLCFSPQVRLTYEGDVWRDKDRMAWYEANPPYDRVSFERLMLVPDRRIPPMLFGLARREALAQTALLRPLVYADLMLIPELRLLGEFREIDEPLFFRRSHRISEDGKDSRARSVPDELKFYDPKSKSRTRTELDAQFVLLRERMHAVSRTSLPAVRRARYVAAIAFGHAVIRGLTPFTMARLHLNNRIRRAWESVSVTLLRRSGNHQLFQRSWVLFAGIRHRNSELVDLALSRLTPETEERMRDYIAGRLRLRRDTYARELLLEWSDEPERVESVRSR
jgi:hypothetical protein